MLNFKGEYQISYPEAELKEMLRKNKPIGREIEVIDVDYRYLSGVNDSVW